MPATYTIHGLARIFHLMEKLPSINIAKADGGSNQLLLRYLAKNYRLFADDAKFANQLTAAGFANGEDLNTWLSNPAKDKFSIPKTSNSAYLGSVYDFDQKWKAGMGEQDPIKGHVAFGVKGSLYLETAFAETDSATLMFWYPKSKKDYPLYCEAADKYTSLTVYRKDDAEIIVPEVNIESDEGSYGFEGAALGAWTIEESTYVNSLTLNKHGAKAKSVVKVAMTKSVRPKPVRFVFDKPFAVAIVENGMKYPAFVAYCDKSVWKKA